MRQFMIFIIAVLNVQTCLAQFQPIQKYVHPLRIDGMLFGNKAAMFDGYFVIGAELDSPVISGALKPGAGSVVLVDLAVGTPKVIYASDAENGDNFGVSVDMDGEWMVVGAHLEDDMNALGGILNLNEGAAYVFNNDPVFGWVETQKLVASDRGASTRSRFGWDVGVNGNFIIVGAPRNDNNPLGLVDAGAAYVFELDSVTGQWNEVAKLTSGDYNTDDQFGTNVDIYQNQAVVGAPGDDEDELGLNFIIGAGSVYIFEAGATGWIETTKMVAPDRSGGDNFGYRLAMDDGLLLVGSATDTGVGPGSPVMIGSGGVYTITQNGAGVWRHRKKIVASDRGPGDQFGNRIAMQDDVVVIGAYQDDNGLPGMPVVQNAGAAYVFQRSPSGKLRLRQKLLAPDRDVDDEFGHSVATDGECIVVGARFEDHDQFGASPLVNDGAGYLYCLPSAAQ